MMTAPYWTYKIVVCQTEAAYTVTLTALDGTVIWAGPPYPSLHAALAEAQVQMDQHLRQQVACGNPPVQELVRLCEDKSHE